MKSTPYSAGIRANFAAHAGVLDEGQSVQIDEQDVRLQLSATATGGTISAMRFRAWGCPHTIGVAEAVCGALEGRPIADLLEFSARDLMEDLSVPVEKTGRILVIEDAVRALGRRFGDGP